MKVTHSIGGRAVGLSAPIRPGFRPGTSNLIAVDPATARRANFLEASSPDVRGQSGGPVFDRWQKEFLSDTGTTLEGPGERAGHTGRSSPAFDTQLAGLEFENFDIGALKACPGHRITCRKQAHSRGDSETIAPERLEFRVRRLDESITAFREMPAERHGHQG